VKSAQAGVHRAKYALIRQLNTHKDSTIIMQTDELTQWLLDAETPSIRYLTLTQLLNRHNTDPDVRDAWRDMKSKGPIPAILSKQTRIGSWAGERTYYSPKYTSTHWSLLLLAELGTDCSGTGMRRGAIYMLGESYDELQQQLHKGEQGLTCFWANLMRYALHCGLDDDPRLRAILDSLVADSGKGGWCCEYNEGYPCAWGAARTLWSLAALPEHLLTRPDVQKAIKNGLSFLLEEHQLVKANYPTPQKGKTHSLWFRLNFPLFYQADILFVLRVLMELEVLDHPGAAPALQWLADKQAASGRCRGASPFRSRTYQELGDRYETDRWATLQTAIILNAAG
jgi:hypothetical protein